MGRAFDRACKSVKDKYKPKWYTHLPTSEYLSEEDKIFLNYYADFDEYDTLFPYVFLCTSKPLYLYNSLLILKTWIATGHLVYQNCPVRIKPEPKKWWEF